MTTITDRLWSIREDLHAHYDAEVSAAVVDAVLDTIADQHRDAALTQYSKVFIEREARAVLAGRASIAEVLAMPVSIGPGKVLAA